MSTLLQLLRTLGNCWYQYFVITLLLIRITAKIIVELSHQVSGAFVNYGS
jgi:hypothetical protein